MPGVRRALHARPHRRASEPAAPAAPRPAERHLGRVEWQRGRAWFAPARRVRHGRRPLLAPQGLEPLPGDYVIAELFEDDEVAYLVEVLGADDDPRYDDLAVASRHRLAQEFPREAELEAGSFVAPVVERGSGRLDLRDRVCFTMDPADARDFDDALSWRRLADGTCEVGIHIADVAWYVRPGSALDAEARRRATSVYLSAGAVPMLPHALSSDLCSLRAGVPRYSMSVLVEMDARGGITHYRIAEGLIESRARLSYEQGQAILDGDAAAEAAVPREVARALRELNGIAGRLRDHRLRRGALDLDVAEAKAWVDEAGRPLRLERRPRLASMSLIEEFMLLGNLLVGEEAERREGAFLYRVHEPPSLGKLAALDAMLQGLGLPRLGGADNVAQALQRLLATSLAPEKRRLVHQLTLRSLARAEYREHDVGHFGLGVRGYCHFTSPIRRYPDLFNHRQVKGWLDAPVGGPGPGPGGGEPDLAGLARHTTGQEQVAQAAERESTRVKALRFFEDRLGEEHAGMITGVVPAGVFVELEEAPVDGFVRVASYVDDDFQMDPAGVKLVGRRTHRRFAMGDRITVRIARVDVPARELELALDAPAGGRRAKGRRGEMAPRPSLAPRERRRKGRRARKDKGRRRG